MTCWLFEAARTKRAERCAALPGKGAICHCVPGAASHQGASAHPPPKAGPAVDLGPKRLALSREAGARVIENFYLRNSSVPVSPHDGRCVEILATGLPLYRGVPLAVDATMVSVLHADGSVWGAAAERDGTAITRAERTKTQAYPELVQSATLRLVTVACEVGGRWSQESRAVLQRLAAAKARSAPAPLQWAARGAWQRRWSDLLSVSQQRALAATLVDAVPQDLDGIDGEAPPIGCVCAESG